MTSWGFSRFVVSWTSKRTVSGLNRKTITQALIIKFHFRHCKRGWRTFWENYNFNWRQEVKDVHATPADPHQAARLQRREDSLRPSVVGHDWDEIPCSWSRLSKQHQQQAGKDTKSDPIVIINSKKRLNCSASLVSVAIEKHISAWLQHELQHKQQRLREHNKQRRWKWKWTRQGRQESTTNAYWDQHRRRACRCSNQSWTVNGEKLFTQSFRVLQLIQLFPEQASACESSDSRKHQKGCREHRRRKEEEATAKNEWQAEWRSNNASCSRAGHWSHSRWQHWSRWGNLLLVRTGEILMRAWRVRSKSNFLFQISYGEMILCENDLCPIEWFHFSCVSLQSKPKGRWYCPNCRGDRPNVMNKNLRKKYQDSPNTDRKFI